MYAAVRRFEGVTDLQKVVQVAKEGFVPIISQMPGFVAYYLVDAGDGVTVSTSVFEHKEAEEQSTFVAGEFVAEHLAPLFPNPSQITAGEDVAYKATSRLIHSTSEKVDSAKFAKKRSKPSSFA